MRHWLQVNGEWDTDDEDGADHSTGASDADSCIDRTDIAYIPPIREKKTRAASAEVKKENKTVEEVSDTFERHLWLNIVIITVRI